MMNKYKNTYDAANVDHPYIVIEATSGERVGCFKSYVEARTAMRRFETLTEADVEHARKRLRQAALNSPYFSRPVRKISIKDELRPTEKGLTELHGVFTYTAISGAIFIAAAGVVPPLALVALPVATFTARWLWRKGKEEGRKGKEEAR
jgi:hypothetical protein